MGREGCEECQVLTGIVNLGRGGDTVKKTKEGEGWPISTPSDRY